jgi:hypothetical protein
MYEALDYAKLEYSEPDHMEPNQALIAKLSRINKQAWTFVKPVEFLFSSKEAPNLADPYIKLFTVTRHHTITNLLRYAPQNRPCPRVITGRLQLKN